MIDAPIYLLAIIGGIIWIASIYDWHTHTIPNYYPLVIIALFLMAAPFIFDSWGAFAMQWLVFLIAFVLGLILYVAGPMGGGDIKLFAALGFWITLPNLLPWILCVTLSGLVITLFFIAYRVLKLRRKSNVSYSEAYKDVRVTEIPYGPAIALGTTVLWVLHSKGLY